MGSLLGHTRGSWNHRGLGRAVLGGRGPTPGGQGMNASLRVRGSEVPHQLEGAGVPVSGERRFPSQMEESRKSWGFPRAGRGGEGSRTSQG